MTTPTADLILDPTWILPIVPARTILTGHSVAIGDGKIRAIGPTPSIHEQFHASAVQRLDGQVLMPGLVNAHGHAAMVLLRGLAEDMPLDRWLRERIWPIEAQWMSPDFVADGIALAMLEMLKSGTTCFSDMYFFPEVSAAAARDAGLRAQIAFPLIEFPNAWSSNAAEGFHKGLALHDEHRDDPLITVAFGPHSAYALGRTDLLKALTYAEEIDAPIHIHLHETAAEVDAAHRELGTSHIHYLADLGLLVPRLQAVHLTQVDDAELDLLVESGVRAVHCPQSNLKLGSGVCDIERFRQRGLVVGLGTDGAAANNTLDLFTELRVAALLAKTVTGDPSVLGAFDALELATLGGARALGLETSIGSIESDKAADLISVDLTYSAALPVHRPEATLVYGASGNHVRHAWVAGRHVLDERAPTTLDERDIHTRATRWSSRLASLSA